MTALLVFGSGPTVTTTPECARHVAHLFLHAWTTKETR